MIEAVDTSVGRILAKVDELGISENTLIIFASDNGGYAPVSQLAPLRGTKGSLFEAGVRVPTCIRWPGVIRPGTVCDTPITSVDFLPTFARLAGAPLPKTQPVDGVDLTPLFNLESIAERSIFWHFPLYLKDNTHSNTLSVNIPGGDTIKWRAVPSTSMRRGNWKLIEYHEDDSVALYNLQDDPGEENDLAHFLPEVTARLRSELDQWQKDTHAPIPTVLNPSYIFN